MSVYASTLAFFLRFGRFECHFCGAEGSLPSSPLSPRVHACLPWCPPSELLPFDEAQIETHIYMAHPRVVGNGEGAPQLEGEQDDHPRMVRSTRFGRGDRT